MTKKLKRCPFCGSEAETYSESYYPFSSDIKYKVICTNDKCQVSTRWFKSEEKAIKAWNKRTEKE